MSKDNNYEIEKHDELAIFVGKWQHHDVIMHQRVAIFLTIQAVALALLAIIFNTPNSLQWHSSLALGLFFLLISMFSYEISISLKADRIARNTFNVSIFKILLKNNLIKDNSNFEQLKKSWRAHKHNHEINWWHTPNPLKEKEKKEVNTTKRLYHLINGVAFLEVVLGIILISRGALLAAEKWLLPIC